MDMHIQGNGQNLLSIVIIARNEATNIRRCIESTLAVAARIPATEIILVDSASTDDTIKIGQEYPINIVQLKPGWVHTPAAGRYIGTLRTDGEYILFVDGDSQVFSDWVVESLDFLHNHLEIAGADGIIENVFTNLQGQSTGEEGQRISASKAMQVKSLGGNSLYRRNALSKVGTFNPYLISFEEAELALRLRRAGYKLWRFTKPMAKHFNIYQSYLRDEIRRFRAGFYPEAGRTLRVTFKEGLAMQFIREYLAVYLLGTAYLLSGVVLFALAFAGWRIFLWVWLGLTAAGFIGYSINKGNVQEAFSNIVARLMLIYGMAAGFAKGAKDVKTYPTDVVVVKELPEKHLLQVPTWRAQEQE